MKKEYNLYYQHLNVGPWMFYKGPYTCKLKALKVVGRTDRANGQQIICGKDVIYQTRGRERG